MQIAQSAVMGSCVSLGHLQRQKSNFFHVWNVDEYGDVLAPGSIEVTDSCLVLHQKTSREAVVWPIKSLRRYGFDAELFSFESGRRCTTGPGVYAFKCHRAQSLFNILQQKILQDDISSQTGSSTIPPLPPPLTTLLPIANTISIQSADRRPSSTPINETDNYLEPIVINRSNSTSSPQPITGNAAEVELSAMRTSIELLMRQLSSSSEPRPELSSSLNLKSVVRGHSLDDETNYAKLDDLLKQEHLYMNVSVSNTTSNLDDISQNDWTDAISCGHCYANVAPAVSSTASKALCSKMRHSKSMVNYPRQVTYAILDLKKRSSNNNSLKINSVQLENRLSVTQPTATVQGYAKIDFDKTTALSNSVNQTLEDDQSVRKTRHNSNVNSILLKRTSFADAE